MVTNRAAPAVSLVSMLNLSADGLFFTPLDHSVEAQGLPLGPNPLTAAQDSTSGTQPDRADTGQGQS